MKSSSAPHSSTTYGGVVVAIVTPCLPSGDVDPPALRRLCRILVDRGCQGIFAIGSTGQMPYLDEDDRRALTVAAREGVGTGATLYVGTSGMGLKQTIRYTKNAAKDGADVAEIMSPMIFPFSQAELSAYVRAVADASPIPLALYHHLRMPTPFQVETIAELAQHPNIVALKDTSTDIDRFHRLIEATAGTKMAVLQGCENLVLDSLKAKAAGCISALANIAPEWHVALLQAHAAGNAPEAECYQRQISGLHQIFRHPLLATSFSYFIYALSRILQLRGWIEHTGGLMPGFEPAPEFDEFIGNHIRGMKF